MSNISEPDTPKTRPERRPSRSKRVDSERPVEIEEQQLRVTEPKIHDPGQADFISSLISDNLKKGEKEILDEMDFEID